MTDNAIAAQDSTPLAKPLTIDDVPELQPVEEGDTLRIPRLVLIQDKHKGIKEGWAHSGELMNSLTRETYGKSVEIVAVYQRPLTRIRWADRMSGGGQLCINRNKTVPVGDPGNEVKSCDKCPFYGDKDPKTGCTMNYEIIALVVNGDDPHFWEPILLTAEYTRPSDAGIRNILENARYNLNRGIRMFQKPFVLSVQEGHNKKGEFFKTACTPGQFNGKLGPNGLLPLAITDWLAQQVKFYAAAKIDGAEAPETEAVGEPEIDPATGAPVSW